VLDVEHEIVGHGRLITCRGARATEERLLADLARLQAAAHEDPRLLAKPVRLIVSSRPLREHLAARIPRRLDGAALGVAIHTLWSAARQILDETGQRFAPGDPLYEVLVRREAGREPALRALYEVLSEGHGLVTATVRDFLSAGLRRGQSEELPSLLAALDPPECERALALARVAERTARSLDAWGARRTGDLLQLAARALERGASALPSRALLVHGFADATGQATALLRALLRRGAIIYLDAPPDPASPERHDRGAAFGARFRRRLAAAAMAEEAAAEPQTPPRLTLLEAAGAEAEVREVAYRIHELLEEGEPPESIGIVARDLAPYAVALRRLLPALAIPFSAGALVGPGGAPAGFFPAHRRLVAVLEMLRGGQELIVDRWLDACGAAALVEHREELRLALRSLGATRLREAAALDAAEILQGRSSYPLPSRQGIVETTYSESPVEGEGETTAVQSPRRRLPAPALAAAIAHANRLLGLLDAWPERAVVADHLAHTAALLGEHLGWDARRGAAWRALLDELQAAIPPQLALRFDEYLLLLGGRAESFGVEPLGGEGGGVQVLDVAHARSLTFDHLFVLGLNRDVFPRSVREDPLLPDAVRQCLQCQLPDLPLKHLGSEEERFLFAELCSAAPSVTLSWQWTDEEGRPRSPSPLVERLRLSAAVDVQRLPRLWTRVLQPPFAGTERRPRPLRDCLKLAALAGDRRSFAELLPLALRGAEVDRSASEAAELARARIGILEEQDPDLGTLDGRMRAALPSPYLGFIAPLRAAVAGDPREGALFVTTLESLARCPWRTFLTRLLRIEVMPDPLAALPGIAALPLGATVHRALAQIVVEALGRRPSTLLAAQRAGAGAVGRPPPFELVRVVEQQAAAVASEEGIRLCGLQRVLATMTLPLVTRALELDWAAEGAPLAVLGAEVLGEGRVIDSAGGARRIGFRADRADNVERLRLSDYKTGRPLSAGHSAETRRSHLIAALERGEWLQAAVYASSAPEVSGRYLFLQPDFPAERAALELTSDDPAVREVLPRVLQALLAAWDEGVFVPRLEEVTGREPAACRSCNVAEACVRGDSGARRRWRSVLLRAAESSTPAVRCAAALWRLGREPAAMEEDE
jgi:hypothetical protein